MSLRLVDGPVGFRLILEFRDLQFTLNEILLELGQGQVDCSVLLAEILALGHPVGEFPLDWVSRLCLLGELILK